MKAGRGRPPRLPGFTFVQHVGEGGFADVFLYRDPLNRQVAVKVLLESAIEGMESELFNAEANVMAQLSHHPSIVSIYQAGVSDDGRPYLVMEYCPSPNLAVRYRQERMAVDDVLEIAVRVCNAVETAHRAGILHRDIKPHNILTTAYGAPMLTDFGIAATTQDGASGAGGVSVPWSPPEAFDPDAEPDVRSDVFSIAATVYTLLAGRSPFEIDGAANDNATLMTRIERQPLARISRGDVPESLQVLLATAMSKQIDRRHPSAISLARACQDVQLELGQTPTRVEVLDATGGPLGESGVAQDDTRTRVRPVAIIVPDVMAEIGTRLRPVVVEQVDDRTRMRPARSLPVPDTMARGQVVPVDPGTGAGAVVLGPASPDAQEPFSDPDPDPGPRPRAPVVVGALLSVILVAGVAFAVLGQGRGDDDPPSTTLEDPSEQAAVIPSGAVPAPESLSVAVDGSVATFSWVNPDPRDGDSYLWQLTGNGESLTPTRTTETRVSVDVAQEGATCVTVRTVRNGALSPEDSAEPVCAGS